jgi:hypothetical protein
MFASVEKNAERLGKLREYFTGLSDGEEVLWIRIEAETGVEMTMAGRELARRALRTIKRPYEAIRGEGIRLSAPDNTLTIMRHRFVRIDNAVRRADRTRSHLTDRHFEQLPPDTQRKMTLLAGFFGAVRAMANGKAKEVLI